MTFTCNGNYYLYLQLVSFWHLPTEHNCSFRIASSDTYDNVAMLHRDISVAQEDHSRALSIELITAKLLQLPWMQVRYKVKIKLHQPIHQEL